MNVRRTRRYTVNMGNFESYTFGADVEFSHHDLGLSDADVEKLDDVEFAARLEELTELVLTTLNEQLSEEIADAANLTTQQKTFLHRAFGITANSKRKRN